MTNSQNNNLTTEKGIIYNVTIKVSGSIHQEWLDWLLNEHIPDVMNTGCFHSHRVVRLLDIDDSEGPTYAVQYHALYRSEYTRYIDVYSNEMRERAFNKWGNHFIAFRTVMELVQ